MIRKVYPIKVFTKTDKIFITRVYRREFYKDIMNLFGEQSLKEIPMFGFIETYVFDKFLSFSFDEFFTPEIYSTFKMLYERYKRKDYLFVCNELTTNTWIKSIFDEDIEKPNDIEQKLEELPVTLLPYQRQYIDSYFETKQKLQLRGGLLAYDQGLGKTITSLALAHVVNEPQVLIICPLSLSNVWKTEILGHIDSNADIGIVGLDGPRPYKYVICSYERMVKVNDYIKKKCFMIVDESHNIDILNTQRASNLLALREKYKVDNILALSGTPIKALASELIPILLLLDPRFSKESTIKAFAKIYNKYRKYSYRILKYRLAIMMERKLKSEVLALPKKHQPATIKLKVSNPEQYTLAFIKKRVIEYAVKRVAELKGDTETQYKYFRTIMTYCIKNKIITIEEAKFMYTIIVELTAVEYFGMSDKTKEKLAKFNIIFEKCYNRLKVINPEQAKALRIIKASTIGLNMKAFGEAMGKIFIPAFQKAIVDMFISNTDRILEIVNKSEKKTIMFSTSVVALKKIYEHLANIGIPTVLITGETTSVTDEIDRFKNDDNINILLASIQKLSTGVTITEASTCIFLDAPYRDADFQQAQDRIYRIGQESEVFIYMLTVDTGDKPNIITHSKVIMDWSADVSGSIIRNKDRPKI